MFWSMGQLFGCPPLSASEPTHSKQWPISYRLVRQSLYWEITTNYVAVVYFVLRLWFVVGFLFWGRKYNAFTPPPRLLQQERARFLAFLRQYSSFSFLHFFVQPFVATAVTIEWTDGREIVQAKYAVAFGDEVPL